MQTEADIEPVLPPDGMDNDNWQTSSAKRQKTDLIIGGVSSFVDMNCHHIKEHLDSHIDAMSKLWKGSINFKCFVLNNYNEDIPWLLLGQPNDIDICDNLYGQFPPTKRLYFDPKKSPPS